MCSDSRWGLIPSTVILKDDVISWTDLCILPALLYLMWQAGFIYITEVMLADKMKRDPTLVTSVRHLAKDKKNGMHQLTKRVCRRLGIFAPDEDFNSEEWKSKIIFFSVQGLYSIIVCIPTRWLYSSYSLR